MKVCSKCSEAIKDKVESCPFCGEPIDENFDPKNADKDWKNSEMLGVISLILSVIGVIAYLYSNMLGFVVFVSSIVLAIVGRFKNAYNSKCKTALILTVILFVLSVFSR